MRHRLSDDILKHALARNQTIDLEGGRALAGAGLQPGFRLPPKILARREDFGAKALSAERCRVLRMPVGDVHD